MKKIFLIVAFLALTAGVSRAGDSFDIHIGPSGFGFHVGGDRGPWWPVPPVPPPGPPPGYYAGWLPPPPLWWGGFPWHHRHGYAPHYRTRPPRYHDGPPRYHDGPPRYRGGPGYPGGRHGAPRHR